MSGFTSREDLIELLKNGDFKEFNEVRSNDEVDLLDFSETDFSGMELTGVNFSNTDLSGADFCEGNISGADFTNSDLTSANFARSSVQNSNFTETLLNGTKFNGAEILRSDFADADMSGADFSEADLNSSDFSLSQNLDMCIFNSYTMWPDSDKLPEDFNAEYIEDLSSLKDDEDQLFSEDYSY
jgi:uncharacterized protein YjbI with pentapeptide repeats